jgi:hypothetical protein
VSIKTLTGFWDGVGGPMWPGLCLNFSQSLEDHKPPEMMTAARSVGIILSKKRPKTPVMATRRIVEGEGPSSKYTIEKDGRHRKFKEQCQPWEKGEGRD